MKMLLRRWSHYVLIWLVWTTASVIGDELVKSVCPIDFKEVVGSKLCYRLKAPETFSDFYKDCSRNMFSSKLVSSGQIDTENSITVWTEYKNAYLGGPFINTLLKENYGHKINRSYKERVQKTSLELEDDLCIVIDPLKGYITVRCEEKHYRFCVVLPIEAGSSEIANEKCSDLNDSFSFTSPVASCLTVLTGTSNKRNSGSNASSPVRATWNQAQDLCEKKGGSSLLNRGWRYANYPKLPYNKSYTRPLGIIMTADHSLLRYDAVGDRAEIPRSDWNFDNDTENGDRLRGALIDGKWHLVERSHTFYHVVCERTIPPINFSAEIKVYWNNKVILTVSGSDSIAERDLSCYTDAESFFSKKLEITAFKNTTNTFLLQDEGKNGYYWCIYTNPITYEITESKKSLIIINPKSLRPTYAIKFKSKKSYNDSNFDSMLKDWEKDLKEYIYYSTKYLKGKEYNEEELEIIKIFTNSENIKDDMVFHNVRVKRKYFDGKTVLLHIDLDPGMTTVMPGKWKGIEVLHRRPVYYCEALSLISDKQLVPSIPLGNVTIFGTNEYRCVGDFNEGVSWTWTTLDKTTTITMETIEVYVENITMSMPTIRPSDTTHKIERQYDGNSSEEYPDRKPGHKTTTTSPCDDNFTTDDDVTVTTTTSPCDVSFTTDDDVTVTTTTVAEEVSTMTITEVTTFSTPITTEPTPLPPEEQVQEVINDLDRLVNDTVTMDNITTVFDQVNTILEVNEDVDIPGRLLHLLDQLGSTVDLNGSHTATAVGTNVALLVGDADPARPIRGLRIATRTSDQFKNDSFEFLTHVPNSTMLDPENNEAVVYLPASVSESARRISFVVFRNDRAFRPDQHTSVNSRILSVNVQNLTSFNQGEVIDIHISPITSDINRNESRACAYWHFNGNADNSGYWSQDGCTFIRATQPDLLDTCRCNHLTHFAEILVPRAVFSERNESALELISVIGCCLSILGLTMVGVTALLFRTWRKDFINKIWLQLCISILFLSTCFLIIAFAKFDHYTVGCMLIGIALHYSVLAAFCWMLVAAVLSYRRLVLVFTRDASHKLLRAAVFAYGAPCAIVGVLLSVAPQSYAGRFDETAPSGSFCYPSGLGLWLTVYAPIAIMLLANWILFALIVRSVFASKRIQRHGDTNEALRCASVSCLLVFLFGLPWIFGLFAYNIVAAYLFTITATCQGFVLFLFFVLGNKKTRDMWFNKLKIKQTRKVPVTSSTYTNRSVGYRGAKPPATLEGRASKPRSLSSSDDSKFS